MAPESDDNLVNTKVRFPCRSTRNRKKGESSKDPKTAHPRRYRVLPLLSRPPVPHAHVVRSSYPIPSILDNKSECDPLPSFAEPLRRSRDFSGGSPPKTSPVNLLAWALAPPAAQTSLALRSLSRLVGQGPRRTQVGAPELLFQCVRNRSSRELPYAIGVYIRCGPCAESR